MNQPVQATFTGYAGEVSSVEQRNRVLRNTYWPPCSAPGSACRPA
jgi:hypothetical protein